jgi:EamA-like transporter family.
MTEMVGQVYRNDALTIKLKQSKIQSKFAKVGSTFGLLSGMTFAVNSIILGIALAREPFTLGTSAMFVAPLVAAAMNDSMTALWLLIYNIWKGNFNELVRSLKTKPGRMICVAAILGGPVAMGSYLLGIQFCGSAYTMPISALCPVVGAILARIFMKQKMSSRVGIGMMICIAGTALISFTPPEGNFPHFYLGLLFAFGSAVGWGAEGALSTFGMSMVNPDVAITIREITSGLASSLIVVPIISGLGMFGQLLQTPQTMIVIGAAALAGAVSFLTWYKANSMIGVASGMALNITYSLWGLVFAFFITGVTLSPFLVVGAIAVTFGAMLVVVNPLEMFAKKGE